MNENSNLKLANRYGGLVRGEGGCNDITTPLPQIKHEEDMLKHEKIRKTR